MTTIAEQIKQDIENNRIVLYMKGTKEAPMCGFSAQVIQLLNLYRVPYVVRNVLDNPELRQGIKEFSNWPTIPQLYVDGEFVGGCDIVTELHQKNDLGAVLSGE